ncbi:hypothetical protein CP972_06045 [Streptomyces prasinus]|uniref:Uncharacterized protein n=1 Tax=Streptomyces prasinus TaxID=67345 RepID=A0ABX6AU00_9ACTN|nr:hypothetical protein CP972_06045 [Streptomyces prasinus]
MFTASSLCFLQRNLNDADGVRLVGVSTYLALIFGTLLSSQGTDASFVLTLAGFPPGASLLCFQHYQRFPCSLTTVLRVRRSRPGIGSDTLDLLRGTDTRSYQPASGRSPTVQGPTERVQINRKKWSRPPTGPLLRNRYYL